MLLSRNLSFCSHQLFASTQTLGIQIRTKSRHPSREGPQFKVQSASLGEGLNVLTTFPLMWTVSPQMLIFCSISARCFPRYGSVNRFWIFIPERSTGWKPKSSHVISLATRIREDWASMVMMALLGFRAAVGKRGNWSPLPTPPTGEVHWTYGMVREVSRPWVKARTKDPPTSDQIIMSGHPPSPVLLRTLILLIRTCF